MHSSAVVAFRALFMVACMIAIPSVALFWKSWPEILESAISGRLPKLVADGGNGSTPRYDEPRGGEAPPFAPHEQAPPYQPAAAPLDANPWPTVPVVEPFPSPAETPAPAPLHPSWTPPDFAPAHEQPYAPAPAYASAPAAAPSDAPPWAVSPEPSQAAPIREPGHFAPAAPAFATSPEAGYAAPASPQSPPAAPPRYDSQVAPVAYHQPHSRTEAPPSHYASPDYAARGQEPSADMHPATPLASHAPPRHLDPNYAPSTSNIAAEPAPFAPQSPAGYPQSAPPATDSPWQPSPPAAERAHSPSAPPTTDRFASMERRLRELGASYYLLETWGQQGELYRFHAKMALSDNPRYNRHFEATHADAMAAMQQVFDQVEAWRAGRAY